MIFDAVTAFGTIGQIVKDHDVNQLRRLGKDHLFVLDTALHQMHENDAGREMANAFCGDGVGWDGRSSDPSYRTAFKQRRG